MSEIKLLFDELCNTKFNKKITVGTDCSGIESPLMALDLLNIDYDHMFSSEIDKNCIEFINRNFPPKKMYVDLKKRNVNEMDYVDLYVAGFPCQTFSSLGRGEGFNNMLKGTIYFYIWQYIQVKKPKVFILENVRALETHNKGKTFKIIIDSLLYLNYNIKYDILNTLDYGIPQSRNRMFIVGTQHNRRINKHRKFVFPTKINEKYHIPLERFLENNISNINRSIGITDRHRDLMNQIIVKYPEPEHDFFGDLWVLNLNVSSLDWFRRGKPYISPCIVTKSNYYIPKYNRYLTPKEALKLQGIPHKKYDFSNFSDNILYKFAGNTISVNVMVALLCNILFMYNENPEF